MDEYIGRAITGSSMHKSCVMLATSTAFGKPSGRARRESAQALRIHELCHARPFRSVSSAKTPAAFKISKIPQRRATCYLDEFQHGVGNYCGPQAMRSSLQAGLSIAISTISFWSSAGMRGRPRGLDFHFQNSRKPCRCQRMNVSGVTIVRACRHGKTLESSTRVNLAAVLGRRGSTWRSRYRANCAQEKILGGQSTARLNAKSGEP